jgi:hypothetical protein
MEREGYGEYVEVACKMGFQITPRAMDIIIGNLTVSEFEEVLRKVPQRVVVVGVREIMQEAIGILDKKINKMKSALLDLKDVESAVLRVKIAEQANAERKMLRDVLH